jgi:hypothetical protein
LETDWNKLKRKRLFWPVKEKFVANNKDWWRFFILEKITGRITFSKTKYVGIYRS